LLELGSPFLGRGEINPGYTLPTGATWHPSFQVFGNYRQALQSFDDGLEQYAEWAHRLDIFGNLFLTPTERLVIGLRPLDSGTKFSGYNFTPRHEDGWRNQFNADIETLFFEGDFGELFPKLDPNDSHSLDYGFAVGRQPLLFQDGIMINDTIDAVGVTRNSLFPPGGSSLRATALYGWDEINRADNREDGSADLFALLTSTDFRETTLDLDLAYVEAERDTGDGFYAGAGLSQRIGYLNTQLRANHSSALDDETSAVRDGTLLFAEISFTPFDTHDLLYLNGFGAIDQYSSAARGPDRGGALGRTGLLFEAVGLGRYGAPLGNAPEDAAGGAVGYQHFLPSQRTQIILEAGGVGQTKGTQDGGPGLAGRYQQAFGRRFVLVADAFVIDRKNRDTGFGGRLEFLVKF
jgi:hypothetical protein